MIINLEFPPFYETMLLINYCNLAEIFQNFDSTSTLIIEGKVDSTTLIFRVLLIYFPAEQFGENDLICDYGFFCEIEWIIITVIARINWD